MTVSKAHSGGYQRRLRRGVGSVVYSDAVGRAFKRLGRDRVVVDGAWIDVSGWEPSLVARLALRTYERPERILGRHYLSGCERVLELGGNRGSVSSALLTALPQSAHLVSVEANDALVKELRSNLLRNCGARRVDVMHCAISDRDDVRLEIRDDHWGSRLSETGVTVPGQTVSQIVDELGWDEYALLADVEGAEAGFILGDDPGLRRCRRMVIELHDTTLRGRDVTVSDLRQALQERHGFAVLERKNDVFALAR